MASHAARVTRFRTFTRYAPERTWLPGVLGYRWALLLGFLLSPSTAHALGLWIGR